MQPASQSVAEPGEVAKPPVGPAREAEFAPPSVECRNGLLQEMTVESMPNRAKTNPCADLITCGPRALAHSTPPASLAWTAAFKPHSLIHYTPPSIHLSATGRDLERFTQGPT